MASGRPLTDKQARFVELYLVSLVASQAYRDAYGCSANVANRNGPRLLVNAGIAAAVADAIAARSVRTQITADRVLQELAIIGFSDARHYTLHEFGGVELGPNAPDVAMRAIASIKHRTRSDEDGNAIYEVEYRLWDKNAALSNLGKHLGLFTEKHEHTFKGGGVLAVPVAVGAEQWGAMAAGQQAALLAPKGIRP